MSPDFGGQYQMIGASSPVTVDLMEAKPITDNLHSHYYAVVSTSPNSSSLAAPFTSVSSLVFFRLFSRIFMFVLNQFLLTTKGSESATSLEDIPCWAPTRVPEDRKRSEDLCGCSLRAHVYAQLVLRADVERFCGELEGCGECVDRHAEVETQTKVGSLVARIVFQPIEETLRIFFSKSLSSSPSLSSSENDKEVPQTAVELLSTLLLFTHFLLLLVFGPPYLPLATALVLPPRYQQTSTLRILREFRFYLPAMGYNGVLEAFLASICMPADLRAQSHMIAAASGALIATVRTRVRRRRHSTRLGQHRKHGHAHALRLEAAPVLEDGRSFEEEPQMTRMSVREGLRSARSWANRPVVSSHFVNKRLSVSEKSLLEDGGKDICAQSVVPDPLYYIFEGWLLVPSYLRLNTCVPVTSAARE
ncbi:Rft protein-domain-containing protein [Lactarius vividus]|nr:Rft protein-domain-containing protein [Lactarius vividus]